jgi:hypothetical protein
MQKGLGWILFAWIMLLSAGVMNIIDGIVALGNTSFWTDQGAVYVYGDLRTWGWIALIWGIVLLIAAASVFRGGEVGRWIGIGAAMINIFLQLLLIPAYPFWALSIMVLDVLVIYGLAVYGGQQQEASRRPDVRVDQHAGQAS